MPDLKSLLNGTLIYGLGSILQRLISFLLLPLFTHLLSTIEYGIISLIGIFTISVGAIISLGTGNSCGIVFFSKESYDEKESVIWSTFLIVAASSVIVFLLFHIFSKEISFYLLGIEGYENILYLALFNIILISIQDPFLSYIRYKQQAKKYVIITVLGTFVTIALNIWLVLILKRGVVGFYEASAASAAFTLFICWFLIIRKINLELNFSLFLPLIKIGFPSIFGLFAFLIIDYSDRKIIANFLGLELLGIYSIGYNFGLIITLFIGAFSTAWPQYFLSFKNRPEEAQQSFPVVFKYFLLVSGLLLVFFFSWAAPVVSLMTDIKFHSAAGLVGIIAASYVLKGAYLLFLPALYFHSKLHLQSVIEWSAALVNIVLNFLLIPIYGLAGAAWATFIGYLTLPLFTYFISNRLLAINYGLAELIKVVLCLSIMASACYYLYTFISSTMNIILMVAMPILYILFSYTIVLSEDERLNLRRMARIKR
jgi:O-antigen/teichoic acid export membrane protein